jgi:hypothetical protein
MKNYEKKRTVTRKATYTERLQPVLEMELEVRRTKAQEYLFKAAIDQKVNAFIDIELNARDSNTPDMVKAIIKSTRNSFLKQIQMPEEYYTKRMESDWLAIRQYSKQEDKLRDIANITDAIKTAEEHDLPTQPAEGNDTPGAVPEGTIPGENSGA